MGGGPGPEKVPREREASITAVRRETDLFNGTFSVGHPWERFEGSPQSAASSSEIACPAPGVGLLPPRLPFIKPHTWLPSSQALRSGALAHVDAGGKCAYIHFPPISSPLGEARHRVDGKRRQEGSCCFHRVGATINF